MIWGHGDNINNKLTTQLPRKNNPVFRDKSQQLLMMRFVIVAVG
jgi:hypothetical protein